MGAMLAYPCTRLKPLVLPFFLSSPLPLPLEPEDAFEDEQGQPPPPLDGSSQGNRPREDDVGAVRQLRYVQRVRPFHSAAYDRDAARTCLLAAMRDGVKTGSLTVIEGDVVYSFGEPPTAKRPPVVLRVRSPNFWCRIYASHDLGCGYL